LLSDKLNFFAKDSAMNYFCAPSSKRMLTLIVPEGRIGPSSVSQNANGPIGPIVWV